MSGKDVTRAMADWVRRWSKPNLCRGLITDTLQGVEEMKYNVRHLYNFQYVPALDGGIVKSDTVEPFPLKKDLLAALSSFEHNQSIRRIFRTRPHDSVIDTVDPHLFPFSSGKTGSLRYGRIPPQDCIARCGDGETTKMPSGEECVLDGRATYKNDMAWSRRFQWLTFDVAFDWNAEGRSRWASSFEDEVL